MDVRTTIAREWLALLKCLGVGMVVATVLVAVFEQPGITDVEIAEGLFVFTVVTGTAIYAIRLLVRFTRWSLRTVKDADKERQPH